MNGLGNRILLSVLCLFLLCGARADEKEEAFGADIVFKNPQRRWMPQEDLIALLKELSYTKFSDTEFDKKFEVIPFREEVELSQEQRDKLKEGIKNMFAAYSEGGLEAYMRFRTPQGLKWKMPIQVWKGALLEWLDKQREEGKIEEVKRSGKLPSEQEIWSRQFDQITQGKGYQGYWTGVCLKPLSAEELREYGAPRESELYGIRVFESERLLNLRSELTKRQKTKYSTWYWNFDFSSDSKYIEEPTVRQILAQEKKLIYADCFLIVSREGEYECRPIYIRYYWNPDCGIWVPNEMRLGLGEPFLENTEGIYEMF